MSIRVRTITSEDLLQIMEWRMKPEVTRFMYTDPVLTIEKQKSWFESICNNQDVRYWMIVVDNQDAGVISLDGLNSSDGQLGWSYYIGNDSCKGLRIALSLEMSLYRYVFEILKKNTVVSNVLSPNEGVIKLHELCGCEYIKDRREYIIKNNERIEVTFMQMTKNRWGESKSSFEYEIIDFDV